MRSCLSTTILKNQHIFPISTGTISNYNRYLQTIIAFVNNTCHISYYILDMHKNNLTIPKNNLHVAP